MINTYQKRKGEFQEFEYGHYFTFGDLEDCPYSSLQSWAEEQPWYNPEVHFSFIDVDDVGFPYRIAVVKKTVAYVYTYNISDETESYKEWEKWQIKKLTVYP